MDPVSGVISGISLLAIIIVSIILFMGADKLKNDTQYTMRDIVDQVNDAQYYAFKFDKKQDANIKNMEENIINLRSSMVTKEDLQRGIRSDRLCLGNTCITENDLIAAGMGKGGNVVLQSSAPASMGCFADNAWQGKPRPIAHVGGGHNRDTCAKYARDRGFKVFALQSGSECMTDSNAHLNYTRDGISQNCVNGNGGTWANSVYRL
jgi:hypothetical protein